MKRPLGEAPAYRSQIYYIAFNYLAMSGKPPGQTITIRVLARDGVMVLMELCPRASLVPGEYAIIGDELSHIAAFRVTEAAPR